jgi:hypothetical protein
MNFFSRYNSKRTWKIEKDYLKLECEDVVDFRFGKKKKKM